MCLDLEPGEENSLRTQHNSNIYGVCPIFGKTSFRGEAFI